MDLPTLDAVSDLPALCDESKTVSRHGVPVPVEDCGVYQNDQELITLPRILSAKDIQACVLEGDATSTKTLGAIFQLAWDYITELDSDGDFTFPVSTMFVLLETLFFRDRELSFRG